MMIRINLLALHKLKKEKDRHGLFKRLILGLGIFIVIFFIGYWKLWTQVQTLKEEKRILVKQTQASAALEKEIIKLKEMKETSQKRLSLLQNLEKDRHGPVRLMEVLSNVLPKDQLWLTSIKENGPEIRIEGISFSNEILAEYMKHLEASSLIKQVDLIQSTQSLYNNLKVKQFTLTAWTESLPPIQEKK
jgi:type IV pilus assembly protein PilN